MQEGRFFQQGVDAAGWKKAVINEAAKDYYGISDISTSRLLGGPPGNAYQIIGVVKDFNYEHLSVKPKPLIMTYYEHESNDFFIRFREGSTKEGLQALEKIFKKYNSDKTLDYTFLSDQVTALYQKEKRLSKVYSLFTLIAILISSIGLFTIALYDTQRRVKEIGVRKINGAKVPEILRMLNKDFVKWVAIAFVVASPIAWYAMNVWLENFAYRTTLSWWVFALAGVLALGIALLTVSWQSWRAATRNPVEVLRYE
jgi:putative ABC transport system permease protein